eukprot:SM000062S19886  [mRNA]  locus=s62:143393:145934:- [translate_table: standard]
MGSCLGKPAVASGNQATTRRLGSRRHGAAATATWQATGIVALRDGNLQCLPRGVAELGPRLRTLDATNNKLTELTPGLANFTSLQRLVLAHNRLVRIDSEVGSLTALRVLVLDENYLTTLPDEVGQLVRLEMLSVAANQLKHLPNSIGNLSKLTILNVKSNKLTSFPSSIGNCALLEELVADGECRGSCHIELQVKLVRTSKRRLGMMSSPEVGCGGRQSAPQPAAIVGQACAPQVAAPQQQQAPAGNSLTSDHIIDSILKSSHCRKGTLPQLLLKECAALQTLGLHETPSVWKTCNRSCTPSRTPGLMDSYAEFEGRRRTKVDKQIAGNVMMGQGSLDEGVDRHLINKALQQERGHLT